MIPLYLNPKKTQQILKAPYSKGHRKFFSFHEYFLCNHPMNLEAESIENFCNQPKGKRIPDGFIFHAGRTGSTMLVKMLNSIDSVEVFSEIDIVTDLLLNPKIPVKQADCLLKNILYSYMDQVPVNTKVIFKFTSVDTLSISRIAKLFPNVRSVYIFNRPEIILSSQFFRPPRWSKSIDRVFRKANKSGSISPKATAIAKQSLILKAAYRVVLNQKNRSNLKYYSYDSLQKNGHLSIFKWFSISLTRNQKTKLISIKKYDSKNSRNLFSKAEWKARTPILEDQFIFEFKKLQTYYNKLLKQAL